jgi:hypothetical protein
MSRKIIPIITALVAGSALAGAALAHPGGGGGVGGGFGGGVGASGGGFGGNAGGNGFGRGSGDAGSASTNAGNGFGRSNGWSETHPASVNNGQDGRTTSPTADPKVLDRNDKVDSALTKALTRKGITLPTGGLKTACAGFGALGQCVAALHVSRNLNIPGGFDALKTATLAPHGSLGEAIMKLDPSADALGETAKANRQADSDLKASG